MKYKVTKKQPNSRNCLVCGLENELGLKAVFYELDNDEIISIFKPLETHQSYPKRLHGGIAGAILDETIGRAMMIKSPEIWGVTVELNLEYKKPIPLDEELRVVGRITRDSSRIFEGTGEILLKNGDVAVRGYGKYMKMPLQRIANFEENHEEWKIVITGNEPKEIEV